ncbi:hypothetical protein EJ02DRAFT_470644 [Clathrospora elynae]|uniref:Glycosyltransferase 2 n=1 Tax=Clathrospora elynae TaxID=706981 RepID=A0A6A5S9F6_9PLEO|nr:hypothetical protein EJ02DRAFT_470644 [Clathrospora elynae]
MLSKTMRPGDEELGKKYDDGKFLPARRSHWSIWNHTFRWRRRRVLLALAGVFVVYYFFHRTADVFEGPSEARYPVGRPITPTYTKPSAYSDEPTGPPPGTSIPRHGERTQYAYDGQVRFFRLGKTLRSVAAEDAGFEMTNRNIVFAMSSLKSASTLLPMVCEMSKWSRNHVHAAFMGREDIPLEDLLAINGIDKDKCPAVWHDARPDYTEFSSDARAESAVNGAMAHINTYLHPQAAIMDDSLLENLFFVRGMRSKTTVLNIPLIEVPKDGAEDFTWSTRLDAGSLKSWHAPDIDILIQVPPDSSSVLRLLKSIKEADYSGLKPPRIIIELPAELDASVKEHVENFKWPLHHDNPMAASGLTIRRRITNHRHNQEESAIRFLELFYPSTRNSHVLLLSSEAQLSPQYFHFARYALLEYKYSTFGAFDNDKLMGVSLELPSVLLDGKTKLDPPSIGDMHTDRHKKLYPNTKSAPFLWQAPNSHATLFFGDKWAELHSFLGNRVSKHQQAPKSASRGKLVSETLPAWTEYMLEFMRARGYSLLYPALMSNALVTIHNELYHVPEEFAPPQPKEQKANALLDEPFLRGDEAPHQPQNPEPTVIAGSTPLHVALPFNGDLPEVPHLPQVLYDGQKTELSNVFAIAKTYADIFRVEVGGCKMRKGKHRHVVAGEAGDLFCFGEDDWEDDVPEVDLSEAVVKNLYVDALPTVMATATPKFKT